MAERFALGRVKLTENEASASHLAAFFARRLSNGSEELAPLSKLPEGKKRFLA